MEGEAERILALMESRGVEYIVVGGFAVELHGCRPATNDLDLLLRLTGENTKRAISTLTDMGFRPIDTPIPTTPKAWVEAKGLKVFSLARPNVPGFSVDVFGTQPEDFDPVYARTVRRALGETQVVVVGRDDLISMKVAAGRPKDLDDVLQLGSVPMLAADAQAPSWGS